MGSREANATADTGADGEDDDEEPWEPAAAIVRVGAGPGVEEVRVLPTKGLGECHWEGRDETDEGQKT